MISAKGGEPASISIKLSHDVQDIITDLFGRIEKLEKATETPSLLATAIEEVTRTINWAKIEKAEDHLVSLCSIKPTSGMKPCSTLGRPNAKRNLSQGVR